MPVLRILELFSGIGGMRYGFEASGIDGEVMAAIDINTLANYVYEFNHKYISVINKNIQNITSYYIKNLNVNTIFMSPPCQPFTRVGNRKDADDPRTNALLHICNILSELDNIEFILMENVKGFENSDTRRIFINSLNTNGFNIKEFLLTPTELGIPNMRTRYYCLAKRKKFQNNQSEIIATFSSIENIPQKKQCVQNFLEENISDSFNLSENVLIKYFSILDIVTAESLSTNCFTKAYTHYYEGTGSVFSPCELNEVDEILRKLNNLFLTSNERRDLLGKLHLRFFSPKEVANLMCFPKKFKFPKDVTNIQRYRLLGNSLNILVVSKLIKILCE